MGMVGSGAYESIPEAVKNGNWTTRVWENGFKECWFYGRLEFDISNPVGAGVADLRVVTVDVPLPLKFNGTPCATASVDWAVAEWVQTTPRPTLVGIRRFCGGNNALNMKTNWVSIYVAGW